MSEKFKFMMCATSKHTIPCDLGHVILYGNKLL